MEDLGEEASRVELLRKQHLEKEEKQAKTKKRLHQQAMEKKEKEKEEREMLENSKRLKIEKEASMIESSPIPASGTPNKSLNASFSKIGMYTSNIYGAPANCGAAMANSRLNLSNFFLDQRLNSIFGGLG